MHYLRLMENIPQTIFGLCSPRLSMPCIREISSGSFMHIQAHTNILFIHLLSGAHTPYGFMRFCQLLDREWSAVRCTRTTSANDYSDTSFDLWPYAFVLCVTYILILRTFGVATRFWSDSNPGWMRAQSMVRCMAVQQQIYVYIEHMARVCSAYVLTIPGGVCFSGAKTVLVCNSWNVKLLHLDFALCTSGVRADEGRMDGESNNIQTLLISYGGCTRMLQICTFCLVTAEENSHPHTRNPKIQRNRRFVLLANGEGEWEK